MATTELVEATNELFRLSARKDNVGLAETADVFGIACKALSSALDDMAMAQSLDTLAGAGHFTRDSAVSHAAIADFCRTFIRTERELLQSAGLSDGAIRSLLGGAQELLESCVMEPLNVGEFYVRLHRLERRVCGRAGQLRAAANDRHSHSRLVAIVSRGATGVGGAAIVAVNAGAVAGAPVLSAPFALMSTTFGGALVGSVIGSPWDK